MTKEQWYMFWQRFHLAWGSCTQSPEYNKETWKEMQSMLQKEEERK